MRGNQAYNIIQIEKYIDKLKSNPAIKDETKSDLIKKQENKLEHTKNTNYWIVADAVEDPLYATQAHECWHAVYFHYDLQHIFKEEMDKVGGWDIPLTEYAVTKRSEYFAELGAAVTCGMKIDQKLVDVLQNTMRSIQ